MKEIFNIETLKTALGEHMEMARMPRLDGERPKCPSCSKPWGLHTGNICAEDMGCGFWPLENVLEIKKKDGKVASMDGILNLIFERAS